MSKIKLRTTRGRPVNSPLLKMVADCLALNMTISEIAEVTGAPMGTVNMYAWGIRYPQKFERWRRHHMELDRKRRAAFRAANPLPPRESFWTQNGRGERLRQLRAEGKSARECARIIGDGCTRNGVIGYCHRNNLPSPGAPKRHTRTPGYSHGELQRLVQEGLDKGLRPTAIARTYGLWRRQVYAAIQRLRRIERAAKAKAVHKQIIAA